MTVAAACATRMTTTRLTTSHATVSFRSSRTGAIAVPCGASTLPRAGARDPHGLHPAGARPHGGDRPPVGTDHGRAPAGRVTLASQPQRCRFHFPAGVFATALSAPSADLLFPGVGGTENHMQPIPLSSPPTGFERSPRPGDPMLFFQLANGDFSGSLTP